MNLRFETEVDGHYIDIMNAFDRELFEALAPKGAKMEIVEFTGSKKGDKVHIRFISPFKAEWISDITEDGQNDKEAYFVDEGRVLPFGLKYWKHRHIVKKKSENTSIVIDDITYKGFIGLWTILMFPALYLGFYPRKAIYKKYFSEK